MILKLFTQPSCPKCPAVKDRVNNLKDINILYFDIQTEDGLAEALIYGIMSTPSIIIEDDNGVVKEWIGEVPGELIW